METKQNFKTSIENYNVGHTEGHTEGRFVGLTKDYTVGHSEGHAEEHKAELTKPRKKIHRDNKARISSNIMLLLDNLIDYGRDYSDIAKELLFKFNIVWNLGRIKDDREDVSAMLYETRNKATTAVIKMIFQRLPVPNLVIGYTELDERNLNLSAADIAVVLIRQIIYRMGTMRQYLKADLMATTEDKDYEIIEAIGLAYDIIEAIDYSIKDIQLSLMNYWIC